MVSDGRSHAIKMLDLHLLKCGLSSGHSRGRLRGLGLIFSITNMLLFHWDKPPQLNSLLFVLQCSLQKYNVYWYIERDGDDPVDESIFLLGHHPNSSTFRFVTFSLHVQQLIMAFHRVLFLDHCSYQFETILHASKNIALNNMIVFLFWGFLWSPHSRLGFKSLGATVFSAWGFHVLPMSTWVIYRHSSVIPQSKHVHMLGRWIGN